MSGDEGHTRKTKAGDMVDRLRRFFEARDHVRRGICLLNARSYDRAADEFSVAMRLNPESEHLGSYLTRCHVGRGDYGAAADEMARLIDDDPDDITSRVRHAMLLWKRGDSRAAIKSLRDGIAYAPDCAELHFQLGTLIAAAGGGEEAELRFTQALSLDSRHTEAMVSLAMCYAAGAQARRALGLLRRAQGIQPGNARIGQLLSMALRACPADADVPGNGAAMPADDVADEGDAIDELCSLIDANPEIVDAFLDPAEHDADEDVCPLLRIAVERLLDQRGDRAELYYQHGRLLDRLGVADEAIVSIDRAVSLDPDCVPALIQSAKLHRRARRHEKAIGRLEHVVALGRRYADVYATLGQLYQDVGEPVRARRALRQAIHINGNYATAKESLETLSA